MADGPVQFNLDHLAPKGASPEELIDFIFERLLPAANALADLSTAHPAYPLLEDVATGIELVGQALCDGKVPPVLPGADWANWDDHARKLAAFVGHSKPEDDGFACDFSDGTLRYLLRLFAAAPETEAQAPVQEVA